MTTTEANLTHEGRIAFDYATTTALERLHLPEVETPMSRRYLALLQGWIPVGMQYFQEWPKRPNCGHFLGGWYFYGSETIGPLHALAAVISSPEYDARVTGLAREDLISVAIKALRYACFTHDTGPADCVREYQHLPGLRRRSDHPWLGPKWGERGKGFFPESQCGRNLAALVKSAVILRPWLDRETWMMVAAICADYLERFADMAPRSGVYYDTQAEENAWTALGLTAARLFLGRHPAAKEWEAAAQRWMFCAAAAPEDMRDHRQLDGKSIREWCGRTFTLLPDFMAENHGMVHPSYTSSPIALMGSVVNLCRLFGEQEPPHWAWHRRDIYENLKWLSDRYGMFHPVQGMDWPYVGLCGLPVVHAFARLYLQDPDAAYYEEAALALAEVIIRGNGGRVYHPDVVQHCHNVQDPMILWESQIAGLVPPYLAHRLCADKPLPEATAPTVLANKYAGVRTYPHSGFVFHRHARGQTSFSWRNEIMALPLTREGLLTVAPSFGSVLGRVQVKEYAASQRVEHVDVNDKKTGFTAIMRVSLHEESIRQDVLLASLPDGRMVCRETFRTSKACTVERVAQGHLEIMNETFPELATNCIGQRRFYSPDGEYVFPSLVRPTPDDDTRVEFREPQWLNLDDRIGIVIASAGHRAMYHNRHFFTPYHAVSDDLFLNLCEEARCYPADEGIVDMLFMFCPEQHHAETPAETLFAARASSPGTWGILAGTTLIAGNFDAACGWYAFRFPRLRMVPIFAGLTRIEGEAVIYETELLCGRGHYLEPLAMVESDHPVTITALSNGKLYAANPGPREVWISVRSDVATQTISIRPGASVSLMLRVP